MMLYNLISGLNKEKYEPVVVSFLPNGEMATKLQKVCRIASLNVKTKYNPFYFLKLTRILREEKPEILHSHLFHANFAGRLAGKISKVPIIISTVHSPNIGGILRERLLKWTDKFSNINVFVSRAVAKYFIEEKKVSKWEKARVIYNGVDVKKFFSDNKIQAKKLLNFPSNKPILIATGRLANSKGYPQLIEAMKLLKESGRDFQLLILGEGEKRQELENLVRNRKLEDRVKLLGYIGNVPDYLKAGDVFMMSSLWEGFSLSLLEAMASGLVPIATSVGGNPEVIENGVNGFLAEPNNADDLFKKIRQVLDLPAKDWARMGEKSKSTVQEKFSLKKMVWDYDNLYQELLDKTSS